MNYDKFLEDCMAIKKGEIKRCCHCDDDAEYSWDELSQIAQDALYSEMGTDDFICFACAEESIKVFCENAGTPYSSNYMDVAK